MEFHEKLLRLMGQYRYSQGTIAQTVGVSQNLVSLWCRGRSFPDLKEAMVLARLFQVSVDYLADDSIDGPYKPKTPRTVDDVFIEQAIKTLGYDEAKRRLVQSGEEKFRSLIGNLINVIGTFESFINFVRLGPINDPALLLKAQDYEERLKGWKKILNEVISEPYIVMHGKRHDIDLGRLDIDPSRLLSVEDFGPLDAALAEVEIDEAEKPAPEPTPPPTPKRPRKKKPPE